MRFRIFDREGMLEELTRKGRSSMLVVGNHVEPGGVAPGDDEYVIVMHVNRNRIAPGRMDMVASYLNLPSHEYPCDAYLWTTPRPENEDVLPRLARENVYVLDPVTSMMAFKNLGYEKTVYHPGPTTGFMVLSAIAGTGIPTRVAGFSWYGDPGESYSVENHNPEIERRWARDVWHSNPLITFTDECLRHMRKE